MIIGKFKSLKFAIIAALFLLFALAATGCSGSFDRYSVNDFLQPVATISPKNGSPVTINQGTSKIDISFNKSMNTGSLKLEGDIAFDGAGIEWSGDGDRLVITPNTICDSSSCNIGPGKTLILDCADTYGNKVETIVLVYHIVWDVLYVSNSGGDDSNDGSKESPKATIQEAVDSASSGMAVLVSEGYYENVNSNYVVELKDGVSIYGGYEFGNWEKRNPALYFSTIQVNNNASASGFWGKSGISSDTVIDGFTIRGDIGTAIANSASSSPVIQNNMILSRGSNPAIGSSGSSSPMIYNNILFAESDAILNSGGSPVIRNNTVYSGGYSIYHDLGNNDRLTIENNIIFSANNTTGGGVYMGNGVNNQLHMHNNNFYHISGDPWKIIKYEDSSGHFTNCFLVKNMETALNSFAYNSASGNTEMNMSFVDIDGADDDLSSMDDNDWHLTAESPLMLLEGGLNGVHPERNWGFIVDREGIFRSPIDMSTTGWSMGAYEYSAATDN
ncbi:MAG: DUF1565 domain-containing protein [bacterium]|nr:DUF1565 domain-containing protein [bacterium]